MNQRKLQEFHFFTKVCVYCQTEAWLAVVTSLAIYAQTDDPGSRPSFSNEPNSQPSAPTGWGADAVVRGVK